MTSASRKLPVIEVTGVSKGFHGRAVLEDVSLTVAPGEIVAIAGPSGSGKSVLLRLLLGLETPDTGTVRVAGREEGRGLGVVFQGDALFDEMTVAENLAFAVPPRSRSREATETAIDEALAAAGLGPEVRAQAPVELSGGMRKRVALARAALTDSPVLLLDEPTSGLDPASARLVGDAIVGLLAGRTEMACVIVTHDVALVEAIADRTFFMDREARRLVTCDGERSALEAQFARMGNTPPPPRAAEPSGAGGLARTLRGAVRWLGALPMVLLAVLRGLPPAAGPTLRRASGIALGSLPVMLVAGALLGLTTCLQVGAGFAVIGYYDEVPVVLGRILASRLAPLLGGLFLVARTAAAVGAEFSVKAYTEQDAAMRTMGRRPEKHWLAPLLTAAAVTFPLMVAVFGAAFLAGALLAFTTLLGQNAVLFGTQVIVPGFWGMGAVALLRSALTGVLTCGLAYAIGLAPKRSSREIGAGATRSVVVGLLVIVLVEVVLGAAPAAP